MFEDYVRHLIFPSISNRFATRLVQSNMDLNLLPYWTETDFSDLGLESSYSIHTRNGG